MWKYGFVPSNIACTPCDRAYNFIDATTITAIRPIKNISEPISPKKCIGCLPNLFKNHSVIKSN